MKPKPAKERSSPQFFKVKKEGEEIKVEPPKRKKWPFFLTAFLLILISLAIGLYFFLKPFPGRTNFLVLGIAGENHAGGDLTDTIMFASVGHESGKVLVLSLPRDIWVAPLRTKLNSIYHYQGLEGSKAIVEEILGQKVDYMVLVDFTVFEKVVDALGGVEVEVTMAFDDYRYPVAGKENDLCDGDPEYQCRYEHLHFDAGKQFMDGERALKYVRSRFAEGEEGSDFARSERQQRLILAIKNKILSARFLRDPRNLIGLIEVALDCVETDLPQDKYWELSRVATRFRAEKLKMAVLNDNLLISPSPSQAKYDGQWVLVPKSGDWEEIHEYVESLIFY